MIINFLRVDCDRDDLIRQFQRFFKRKRLVVKPIGSSSLEVRFSLGLIRLIWNLDSYKVVIAGAKDSFDDHVLGLLNVFVEYHNYVLVTAPDEFVDVESERVIKLWRDYFVKFVLYEVEEDFIPPKKLVYDWPRLAEERRLAALPIQSESILENEVFIGTSIINFVMADCDWTKNRNKDEFLENCRRFFKNWNVTLFGRSWIEVIVMDLGKLKFDLWGRSVTVEMVGGNEERNRLLSKKMEQFVHTFAYKLLTEDKKFKLNRKI